MLRYHNRILELPSHRLPRIVYDWEVSEGSKCWIKKVSDICSQLHLPPPSAGISYDMENVNAAAYKHSVDCWWCEALEMSKLCIYTEVKLKDERTNVVQSNLRRYPRSAISQLLCGILPLEVEVEVGHFTD